MCWMMAQLHHCPAYFVLASPQFLVLSMLIYAVACGLVWLRPCLYVVVLIYNYPVRGLFFISNSQIPTATPVVLLITNSGSKLGSRNVWFDTWSWVELSIVEGILERPSFFWKSPSETFSPNHSSLIEKLVTNTHDWVPSGYKDLSADNAFVAIKCADGSRNQLLVIFSSGSIVTAALDCAGINPTV